MLVHFQQKLTASVKEAFDVSCKPEVQFPKNFEMGNVSSNIAMKLAKELKMSPMEIAQRLALILMNDDEVEHVEAIAPGFLNITVTPAYILSKLTDVYAKNGWHFSSQDSTIIVEYGAENVAKSMTVGHLRSNIIGQSLYNLYKTLGWNVVGDNHLGDWGTQFGKLIVAYRHWGDKETIDQNPIEELVKLYVRFHEEAENNSSLEDEARREFKKLEDGDDENMKLWQWFYDVSMREIQEMHTILGIHHDTMHGESFYYSMLKDTIQFILDKNIAQRNEDGSIAIDLDDDKIPSFLVQKSDGATLYHTRDFATLKYRMDTYNPEKILYVVGDDQSLFFRQLFAAAEKIGWKGDFVHVGFGMVMFPEGKMSTRKGKNIKLRDLIDEGLKRAEALMKTKNVQTDDEKTLTRQLTIGSIKFNDLSQNRTTAIQFDWDRMLSFEGDTAPYLQYAYVRIQSILRKAEDHNTSLAMLSAVPDLKLASKLMQFPDVLHLAAREYKPNYIASYLLELASEFASFYESTPVLHEPDDTIRSNRIALLQVVGDTLKQGLSILGIECPEKM